MMDNTNNNGIAVVQYHTGAGFNDATLTPDKSGAAKGWYNASGTYQMFDLGSGIPWGLTLGYGDGDTYVQW